MSDVKTLREKRGVGILPAFILAYSILIRFRISLLTQEEEVNLGTKDSKAKEYLSDNTRFSEICNYVLFDGEKVIKPENLKECDTTEVLSVFGIDRKQIVKQKWRDLLKGGVCKIYRISIHRTDGDRGTDRCSLFDAG